MLPGPVTAMVDAYLKDLDRALTLRGGAVYLVGSSALGDFSDRQSNVDLVVVTDPGTPAPDPAELRRAERRLAHSGRDGSVWYTDWDEVATGRSGGAGLDTPMTRALLKGDALAVQGPDWPVVAFDEGAFRAWCRRRLAEVAVESQSLMLFRRRVVPVVLEAARLAYGAIHGKVLSKSEAGEAAITLVAPYYRRILSDAVGYRQGANTSMYWGPFERKYDARRLVRDLVEAAA